MTRNTPATDSIFPATRHAELRAELDYSPPAKEEPSPEPDFFAWNWELGDAKTFWIIVLSSVVLLVIGIIVYRILGELETRRNKQNGPNPNAKGVALEEIVEEELVAEGVKLSLLERAEAAGQYDVAVRLLYIRLLKELNDDGHIRYRRDFSNHDYRQQLAGSELRRDFDVVTADYEKFWYGKYALDRLTYRLSYQKFTALEARIAALRPEVESYE